METKWELKSHSHQIADTGDYDGCYEITDGKVSIFSNDEEALQPIVDALNDSGCKLYIDDSSDYEAESLKKDVERLHKALQDVITECQNTWLKMVDTGSKQQMAIYNCLWLAKTALGQNPQLAAINDTAPRPATITTPEG